MRTVKVQHAKTHLSALLAEVEAGEEIVIARGDQPVARLVGIDVHRPREVDFFNFHLPEDFDDPLPDEELALWEGRHDDLV
ncbi:MAG: type II toxin-antitoxin system Phd/YefM family antitoxin [Austwickia sp.]|nr:type II toxin-antitoxin system Phd/YefM family antitoxin [Actinomycetota bacterium]MCB1255087.1 type II toxin-antitoxin system Phd/YefM family antitoxin [Austwickia sp.]MCO5308725.1 type II toxin-antitoxin system Phd/YefM family antitoxin [Austwickia sp.]